MPCGRLSREMDLVKLSVSGIGKDYLPDLLRIGCTIHLIIRQAPSGGSRVGSNGIHPSCNGQSQRIKINQLALTRRCVVLSPPGTVAQQ